MGKLNTKERSAAAQAEDHLRAAFGNVSVSWEIIKPTGSNFASIAGFVVVYNGAPRLVILQVFKEGTGWEVFGAPSVMKIAPAFDALKSMWSEPAGVVSCR